MSNCEECRLCGKISPPKMKLSDKIKGFLSFKEFIEYFCRIDLDDINNEHIKFPTAVCHECYFVLLNFCKFTVNVETQQNKFKNRLPQENLETFSGSKRKYEEDCKQPTGSKNKEYSPLRLSNVKKKSKTDEDTDVDEKSFEKPERNVSECLNEVYSLFKDEIEVREKQYEKITIKESLLLDYGEIPRSWLERYREFITWQDFSYQCCHCNKQIKSLNNLLKHFEEYKIPIHKRLIKCHCGKKEFNDITYVISYLNHMSKDHYNHLKFTCMFCSKVYVNVVKLSQHIEKFHSKVNLKYFPCFDCGLTCSSFEMLKNHKKKCHEI